MTQKIRTLTGITTTGTPHLGNYVGAIRPALVASHRAEVESFYFLADFHALIKCEDPARVARSRMEIAATWLALGLDTGRAFFYRQSDIPEIPELTWLLTCVTAKGLLNRAHAYKAAVDHNLAAGVDTDAGINAGLYMYPVLMAADILIFNADRVPVGRDQIQHIEMARDIAQRFNHLHGAAWRDAGGIGREPFTLPQAQVEDNVAILPGTDGRKMSKSYDNTIPLWLPAARLKDAIYGIVTDSHAPGEPKDPEKSSLFALYEAFASAGQVAAMREAFAAGIGWGDAKQALFECVDAELAEPRSRYEEFMQRPDDIEDILIDGARRARARAQPFLESLRAAVGLGRATSGSARVSGAQQVPATPVAALASFKTWREPDGRFYFRLVDADDTTLLHSCGHGSGRDAGQYMAQLLGDGSAFAPRPHARHSFALHDGDGAMFAYGLVDEGRVQAALDGLRAARKAAGEKDAD